jgi:cell fate regulator YaaT (PSP1 superfamily)
MPLVIGVAFQPVTKVYYFDPAGHNNLQPDEYVIVETSRGRTLGQVVFSAKEVPASELSGPLKPVIRRATAPDMVQADQAAHQEDEALRVAQERSGALNLPMKVVKAEYNFDGGSLVVYFTSEQRVDFRTLVHDLGQALHTRVEMRQVGVRDHAKFVGGYGRCGRPLCCSSWLREFVPVSIKMAKQQDLPLNTSEVSGLCGRLLCCLAYENDFYTEARKQMPRINSTLDTPEGPGKVKQVHVLASSVTVLVEGPNETRLMIEVPVDEPVFGGGTLTARPQAAAIEDVEEDLAPEDVVVGEAPIDRGDLASMAMPAGKRNRRPRQRKR